MGGPARRHFDLGAVFGRALGNLSRNLAPLFFAGLVVCVTASLLLGLTVFAVVALTNAVGTGFAETQSIAVGLSVFLGLLVTLAVQFAMMQAMATYAQGEAPRRARFADCLAAGLRHAAPVAAIQVLSVAMVLVGQLFLVVPGVLLGVVTCVAVPAYVAESTGVFKAFSRSIALTQNHRWAILGVTLLMAVGNGLAYVVASILLRVAAEASRVLPSAAGAVTGITILGMALAFLVLFLMVNAAVAAALYAELKVVRSGAPGEVAQVFA